jgi:hypothetical protein
VNREDGGAGQDVLRRAGEASVLILISLASGTKHGYALIQDIRELARVEMGPGRAPHPCGACQGQHQPAAAWARALPGWLARTRSGLALCPAPPAGQRLGDPP